MKNIINNKKSKIKNDFKTSLVKSNKINNIYNMNKYLINLYLPNFWKFILIKIFNYDKIIYIYNNTYFFIIPVFKAFSLIKYDLQTNTINFKFYYKNNFFPLFWNFFKTIFFSFSKQFFKKLKFKGKGYYIYKNIRNTIALQFGYSHLVYLYFFFIKIKFLTKTTILVFGINKTDLFLSTKNFYNVKRINIFTSKGIRFSKQIIYKKTGKVSSYR